MSEKKMHNKGLTSFFMTFGFIVLFITGVILYIVPAGRVANWVHWTFLGLTKPQWGNIHILSGFVFLIAGIFHIYFNWKPLKKYFYSRAKQGINLKKEMVISTIATIVLVWAAIADLPPFSYVFEFGEFASDSWVTEEKYEAPIGHGELLALSSFTAKLKIDTAKAMEELEKNGVKVGSSKDSLERIAKENDISPMEIYSMIQKFEPSPEEIVLEELTAEKVEDILEGKGVGRRNISWLTDEFKLEMEKAKRRLAKNKIEASEDESFHDIADRYNVSPMDIVKVILVRGHSLS